MKAHKQVANELDHLNIIFLDSLECVFKEGPYLVIVRGSLSFEQPSSGILTVVSHDNTRGRKVKVQGSVVEACELVHELLGTNS